jgi:hypothetical protein
LAYATPIINGHGGITVMFGPTSPSMHAKQTTAARSRQSGRRMTLHPVEQDDLLPRQSRKLYLATQP